jgi:hypothetical protein
MARGERAGALWLTSTGRGEGCRAHDRRTATGERARARGARAPGLLLTWFAYVLWLSPTPEVKGARSRAAAAGPTALGAPVWLWILDSKGLGHGDRQFSPASVNVTAQTTLCDVAKAGWSSSLDSQREGPDASFAWSTLDRAWHPQRARRVGKATPAMRPISAAAVEERPAAALDLTSRKSLRVPVAQTPRVEAWCRYQGSTQ